MKNAADVVQVLERLRTHASRDGRSTISVDAHPASAVCTFIRHGGQSTTAVHLACATVVVVLEGSRELHIGPRVERAAPGSTLVLPAGWRGNIVDEPDPQSGVFRAFCLEFPLDLVVRAYRAHPVRSACTPRPGLRHTIGLSQTLADAILHTASAVAAGTLPAHLIEHRAMEVLLVLTHEGVLSTSPTSSAPGAKEAVRALVSCDPARRWTAAAISRHLGLSEPTLRRRLRSEDASVRELLQEVRIELASALMREEGLSVAAAAEASGYRSRKRFSERFKANRGRSPSAHLSRGLDTGG